MNGNTNKSIIKNLRAICCASVVSLAATGALAETHVRFQTENEGMTVSEGYKLSVEDWSEQKRSVQLRSKQTAPYSHNDQFRHSSQSRPQVWIADIGTLLFDDYDGDGYHSGFSLTMDIDSEFGDTDVYIKIYMQPAGENLLLLHQTERFTVYGVSIGDEYRVDTELRNNYVANTYNLVIDIHDAWDDTLLDTANSRGFDNLKSLPLEASSNNADIVYPDWDHEEYENDDQHHAAEDHQDHGAADVVVTEYAASFGPTMGGIALLILSIRIRQRRSSQQKRNKEKPLY